MNSWPLPYQGSALPLRHKGIFQKLSLPLECYLSQKITNLLFGRVPAPQRQMPQGLREKFSLLSKKPVIGIEPTTYGLQNRCSTVELYRRQNLYYRKQNRLSTILLKNWKFYYTFLHIYKNELKLSIRTNNS